MRADLQEQLARSHPLFFDFPESPVGPARKNIRCGDGWYPLLEELFASLAPLMQANAHLSNPPRLYEIESRNHRLKVLLRPATPEMATMMYAAADRSERVCENCGAAKEWDAQSSLCPACRGSA